MIRKTPPTRLPSIDRRPLDLFKFRNNVRIRGGYEIVCQKKLWAQIGRELGYSGKITSSLSSSLKSAYQRVIYQFDLFEKDEREKKVKSEAEAKGSESVKSEANGVDLTHNNELKKSVKFDEMNLDCFKVGNSLDEKILESTTIKTEEKLLNSVSVKIEEGTNDSKNDIKDDKFKSLGHATSIIGSSTTYERPRDLLISKGIPIYFDAATDHRLGVSVIENTIPDYNFNLWHKDSLVSDSSPYECKSTSLYNLKQFFEKGSKIKEDIIRALEETNEGLNEDTIVFNLENLFWKLLNDKKNYIEIESAFDLPTSVHNSAFPKFERFDSELKYNRDISISKWNLNNLPFSGNSIMQYINEDIMNLFEPLLNISMIYSSRSFHMQDHLLYTADFNHLGGSKVWYFISPEDQEKYEELIKNYESQKLNDDGKKTDIEIEQFYEILKNTESTSVAIENRIPIEVPTKRNQHKNLKFDEFISKDIPFHFNRDLFLSPKLLQDHGLKISKVVQNPGEFIIVFPKTYSSEVSMDSIVSEIVHIDYKQLF
ncbi:unnamed protein product [[Candida] boidinii]|uniref:Unnamed protein product n=1 Tax=Candida boidinii TaxID=5477 RepID=A0ACB5TUN2_CANBO|nr:unnamed protein product [[Candida] boidinii]